MNMLECKFNHDCNNLSSRNSEEYEKGSHLRANSQGTNFAKAKGKMGWSSYTKIFL